MANIISLTIENFRSYKNKTTFTFEAVDVPEMKGNYHDVRLQNGKTIRLLNSAIIFGPNGAGKSNVIIALWAIHSFVRNSINTDPGSTLRYEPYMLSEKTRNNPICFSVRFIANGTVYDYAFSYNKISFLSERLVDVEANTILIERGDNGQARFNSDVLQGMQDMLVLRNHLALSDVSRNPNSIIQAVYKELTSMKIILRSEEYPDIEDETREAAAAVLAEEPNGSYAKMLRELMLSSDTGITGVMVRKINADQFAFPETVPESVRKKFIEDHQYSISMVHPTEEGENITFPLSVESTGTQTLFKAGSLALQALEEGGVLAYDEMNIALHPMVFRRLVDLFNDEKTNPNHAQLLVTTHDATLMKGGVLRADQIWLTQKKHGVSELYSAIDFNGVSIDQSFEPLYKAGRLGGLPHFTPFRRPQMNPLKKQNDEQK